MVSYEQKSYQSNLSSVLLLSFSYTTTKTKTPVHLSMLVTDLHYGMKCMLTDCVSFRVGIIMHVVV